MWVLPASTAPACSRRRTAAALRRATKHYDPKVKAAAEAALKKLKP